jgi:signal peptidase I
MAGSNSPTFLAGEHLLSNKLIYRFTNPEREDFIIFKYPKDESITYVKRVIGLPGETIELKDKKLDINNNEYKEDYSNYNDENSFDFGPVTVPKNQYFLLGDNRDNSQDSRYYRSIERDKITARIEFILNLKFSNVNKAIVINQYTENIDLNQVYIKVDKHLRLTQHHIVEMDNDSESISISCIM